jgi:hypothetical protein
LFVTSVFSTTLVMFAPQSATVFVNNLNFPLTKVGSLSYLF